jgi:hypothetical protein
MRKRANQESEIGVHKYEGFTMMQNHHLRNKGLSLKAVGLLSKILSLPPDWDYSLRGLATLNTDGIDGIRSAMKELEDHGYVVRTQRRDENGRMSKSRYEVYEIPQPRKPTTEKPSSENPTTVNPTTANPTTVSPITENPTQINTNQVITQETNYSGNNYQSINLDGMDRMDLRARYEEIIRDNLELDILSQDRRFDIARVNEMVEIMLDAVCSTRPTICINGEDMPQQVVKSRFLKLNSSHIEYVLHAMDECPSDIRNIRAYMLTTLYNASLTMDNYYSALVNHDLYGQK